MRARDKSPLAGTPLFSVLGLPALLWFFAFLLGPLLYLLGLSFLQRGTYGGVVQNWQLHNYEMLLRPVYLEIFWKSFVMSTVTSALCLLLSLPIAWGLLGIQSQNKRTVLIFFAIPFFLNQIARIYSFKTFLSVEGPVAKLLTLLGSHSDFISLSQSRALVMYGLVMTYLPYMLLPIWIAFEKMDPLPYEAALDLGASRWRAFVSVVIPSVKPSIAVGLLLVQVPVMGEYVIPDLLGGAKTMLIGNLVSEQFLKVRDWPFGAAMAVEVILLLTLMSVLILRWGRGEEAQ